MQILSDGFLRVTTVLLFYGNMRLIYFVLICRAGVKLLTNGMDRGKFMIPPNKCYMNNYRNPEDERYCPVCHLAIIDRISQLSGATFPWE